MLMMTNAKINNVKKMSHTRALRLRRAASCSVIGMGGKLSICKANHPRDSCSLTGGLG